MTDDINKRIIQMSQRYETIRLIGKGRAGEVYESEDTVLERRVAMRRFTKDILDPERLDDHWKKRFVGLIGGLSQMTHPNILRVIDGGLDSEGPYIITSFIDGMSLEDLAYEEGFNVVDAYEMAQQVLDALVQAMKEGYFHYALSPTSVIAKPRNTGGYNYILTDLGHSKLLPMIYGTDKAIPMTQAPALLAPELYKRKPQGVKTSQYLLGHLLYWMLAAGHPYGEMTSEEAYQHHKLGDIPCISTYRPEIPKEFVSWMKVMMDPNLDNRFETAEAALEALPEPPKRYYSKKVKKAPKKISKSDLDQSA